MYVEKCALYAGQDERETDHVLSDGLSASHDTVVGFPHDQASQVAWQVAWQVLSGVFHQFLSILFCFHVNCCRAKVRRAILWEMFGYFKAAQPAAR